MSAVFSSLELDHHEISFTIQAKKVNSPFTVFPICEFLRDDHTFRSYHVDRVAQQTLNIWFRVTSLKK